MRVVKQTNKNNILNELRQFKRNRGMSMVTFACCISDNGISTSCQSACFRLLHTFHSSKMSIWLSCVKHTSKFGSHFLSTMTEKVFSNGVIQTHNGIWHLQQHAVPSCSCCLWFCCKKLVIKKLIKKKD